MSDVGLNDVVESGNLEPRDGVEGESSRARGREIVYCGYCEGVQFNPGRAHSF